MPPALLMRHMTRASSCHRNSGTPFIWREFAGASRRFVTASRPWIGWRPSRGSMRSEEHTSELQSLMRISYAVFCLKKKKHQHTNTHNTSTHNTTSHDNKQHNILSLTHHSS